jgi:transcriptional regulator GlxA family with amidase domain
MDVLTKLQTPPFSFPGIDELAKQKNMSRRSFTRAFRKNTGASVMEYYNSARNTYARFLLKTSDLSIKEIAFLCGYSNSQNMRRALARDNG